MRGAILALDLGSNTGWCGGDSATPSPLLGSLRLAPGLGHGARGTALVDWLADHVPYFSPWLICYESPLQAGQHKSDKAARLAHGLAMAVEMFCFRQGMRCLEGRVMQARKAVLGRGNATKDDGEAACRRARLDPCDQDASDAWVLWRFAIITRGQIGPIDPF